MGLLLLPPACVVPENAQLSSTVSCPLLPTLSASETALSVSSARLPFAVAAVKGSFALVVSSPLMIVGLVVGVVVSLFQALTQIQEQTLVFVPKILAIFVTLLLALPFMADAMHAHMMRITSRIIGG